MTRMLKHARSLGVALVPLAVLGIAAPFLSGELADATTLALINVVFVVGLFVFVGLSGVASFGQMAFGTIGGYAAAYLTVPVLTKQFLVPGLPHFLATAHVGALATMLVAGALAAVVSAVVGYSLMRLNGLAAGISTLALLVIVNSIAANATGWTSGDTGLGQVPVTTTVGVALGWAVFAVVLAYGFSVGRTGLRLRSSRDEEVAARSIGIGVTGERLKAFMLSAFLFGVGGALYVSYTGFIGPSSLYLDYTFLVMAMLVVGGLTSLPGAVVGSLLISAISELLRRLEDGSLFGDGSVSIPNGSRPLGIAVVMLAAIILNHKFRGGTLSWVQALFRGSGRTGPPRPTGREIPTAVTPMRCDEPVPSHPDMSETG
jgi:branched-chain amino acid transport system permease protein